MGQLLCRRARFAPAGAVALVAFTLLAVPLPAGGAANEGEVILTVAGTGVAGSSGDGGPASAAQLNQPNGVTVDDEGHLYIAEEGGHRVRRVDPAGVITTVAGDGVRSFGGDGGPAVGAQLDSPYDVATDGFGNLYIADLNNSRIRKVDSAGVITTFAGGGAPADGLGDGGLATDSAISRPFAVETDDVGNVFIATSEDARIRRVDAATGIITTVAGTGEAGFGGDGGPATDAQLDYPLGLEVDEAGNLFISDFLNQRVRRVDTSGIITTMAGTGEAGFGGDGGPATEAQLNKPRHLSLDVDGNLFFPEDLNQRVRRVDTSGIITTVAGTGEAGFGGDGGPPLEALFNDPVSIVVDGTGAMFIGDRFNHRVRRVGLDQLALVKSGAPDPVNVGQQLTYTLEVTNHGSAAASGVTLTDALPADVTFVSASASAGTCSQAAGTVTCLLGELNPGATVTVTMVVTPTATGLISNTATVTTAGTDPFLVNNAAAAETTVGDKGCGQVITRNTRLAGDIGPCPGDGLIVGADEVVINLNGHSVFGFEGPGDGTTAGIRFPARRGAAVLNGTVSGFDAGVFINGGHSNQVRDMTIADNVGPDDPFGAELGDGIAVFDSASNRIIGNLVVGNGIFDGIGVLGGTSDKNIIVGNIVEGTVGPSDGGPAGQGIIVNAAGLGVNDGSTIVGTKVVHNEIRGSGSAGIANINSVDAQIVGNVVEGNGLTNGDGNGIGVQLGPDSEATATRALLQGNEVHGNGLDGIHIRESASENRIIDNDAADNNVLDFGRFDLRDYNPDCDANVWDGNTWGSGYYAPTCTTAGGSGPIPEPEPEVFGEPSCFDDVDNDQDGLVDGDDPDCSEPLAAPSSAASSGATATHAKEPLPPVRRVPVSDGG